ncbi:MAG: leucine-rich repeat domain-containing protein, partial [Oscillospiraceae bacterium]|nr:leucine-rich repeat domain-containing protein [Oscillospiraceae bacterium]
MKGKRFLSITVAAACLLMNVPASAFAAGTAEAARTNETAVSQAVSASAVKTAQVKVTASEPYTLTIDDVKVYQCREDDNNSDSPLIEALWIFGLKDDVDFSDAKYKNIVIPETLPYEVPDLDKEGKEQKDEEGNVIKKTVVMPVIKFGLGSVAKKNNLEKLTFSKNLRVFTDNLADYKNLSEIVIPEDSSLESFASGAFQGTSIKSIYIPASVTSLADNMFFNCTSLTSVTFAPDSKLQKIGAYAFSGTSLESIDIPATVTEIGESAFGINY